MCDPPARIECTNVNTLRPGRAPPTRPTKRTLSSINGSNSSRSASVAGKINPALATRLSSSKMTSIRSNGCDTRVTESASRDCGTDDVRHRHRPSSGGLSRGYAHHLTPNTSGGSRLTCPDGGSVAHARLLLVRGREGARDHEAVRAARSAVHQRVPEARRLRRRDVRHHLRRP